ncbi:hypothetical protein SDC9_104191 [bioreactor metagenome]|uniref:Uncharacterized protein n=1 Tax=bioreactor metagenome TaxID=1076179 RepID=A0A645AW84_9ZZZZ
MMQARTTRVTIRTPCTLGSGVKRPPSTGRSSTSATPTTTPKPTPQTSTRRVIRRVPVTSPAPSRSPIRACAAIANASRAYAIVCHRLYATWWPARATSPIPAAVNVVTAIATWRVAARRISQPPDRAAASTPPNRSSNRTPWLAAPRSTVVPSTAAPAHWDSAVPIPAPAIPRPAP